MNSRTPLYLLAGLLLATALKAQPAYRVSDILTANSPNHSRDTAWMPGSGIALEVSGMQWLGGDRLAVCIRKGEVWFIDGILAGTPRYHRFASGLHEPLGLLRDGKDLLVAQRAEITRLQDRDGNLVADAYLSECSGWGVSGAYHAYTYGPARDAQGRLWVTLNLDMGDHTNNSQGWRGWGGTIGDDGQFVPQSGGMRSPCGLGANLAGDLFFSDQQGTWIPASPIYHLRPGVFYGNPQGLGSQTQAGTPQLVKTAPKANQLYPSALRESPTFVPPAVWLPYNKMGRSATDIQVIPDDERFGPFGGQLLIGEFTNAEINRVFMERVNGEYQGACFPFLKQFPAAVFRLCFADDGSLLVGMTNRGWSSLGRKSYGLQRVTYEGRMPFAIQKMEATKAGFRLTFTKPLDPTSVDAAAFECSAFTYQYAGSYGGPEKDMGPVPIETMTLGPNQKVIELQLPGRRAGYVHELRCMGLTSSDGQILTTPTAWYTLNQIP